MDNNCKVIGATSETDGCLAENVISDDRKVSFPCLFHFYFTFIFFIIVYMAL